MCNEIKMRECCVRTIEFDFMRILLFFSDVRPSRDLSGTKTRGGGRSDRSRGVDRGKRGHNSHLVQTQGLFSEGAGAVNVKRQMPRCEYYLKQI